MKNNVDCLICKNNNLKRIGPLEYSSATYKNLNLMKCFSCDFVFADPMPSDSDLELYNSAYFKSAGQDITLDQISISFFKAISKIRLNYLIKYKLKQNISIKNVLEIGPGPGFFVESFLDNFPDANYYVSESDKTRHNSLLDKGAKIIDLNSFDEKIDLIVISHVLEHVSDPEIFLINVTKNLKRGGLLFIEVPCLDFKHKKVHEPHLLFFDKKPLRKLLNNLNYDHIKLSYHGTKISQLMNKSIIKKIYYFIRYKLLSVGVLWPFSIKKPGMDLINSKLERASVSFYEAHKENKVPSWWLRAAAIKN
tara:strand:- start:831 stop:1754 length:924 start_codon:yes stop_codon:yes gene_type:complete